MAPDAARLKPIRSARPGFSAGVIDEAWARRRRRLLVVAAVAATLAVTIVAVIAILSVHHKPSVRADSTPLRVAPSAVLSRTPYMGVVCPVANSTTCDRVGLSVWLRNPAVAVSATIAGRPLTLDTRQARPFLAPGQRARTMFVGYLQPAGIVTRLHAAPDASPLRWWAPSPTNAPSPPVELRIDYGTGRTILTKLDVPLEAGWG
jgi:hypothetical protein